MTKPTTLLPGVSLTLLLSAGCAVGPNYKRPSVDVPGMCRGRTPKDVKQPAPESLGDLERWEVFHDKQLQDLIHTGLQQNYDVRVAATRILEAQAHVGITRTNQLPVALSFVSVADFILDSAGIDLVLMTAALAILFWAGCGGLK